MIWGYIHIYIYVSYFWRKCLCYSVVSFFIHALSAALASVVLRKPAVSMSVNRSCSYSSTVHSAAALLVWHDGGFLFKQWLFPTCTGPCWSANLGPHVGHVCLLCQMCNPLGTCTATFHTYLTKNFYKIAWLLATWDKARIQGGAQSIRSDSTNLPSASPAGFLLLLSV